MRVEFLTTITGISSTDLPVVWIENKSIHNNQDGLFIRVNNIVITVTPEILKFLVGIYLTDIQERKAQQ